MNENDNSKWESISRPRQELIKLGNRLGITDKLVVLKRLILNQGAVRENTVRIDELFQKPLDEWKEQVREAKKKHKPYTLVVGDVVGFDKGICHYLNTLSESIHGTDFLLLSEAENQNGKIDFKTIIVPDFLIRRRKAPSPNVIATHEILVFLERRTALKWCVSNYLGQNKDLTLDDAVVWTYYSYHVAEYLLDQLKPQQAILWNVFYDFHHIMDWLCRKKGIPTIYMEFGSIPGTFSLEKNGQMGRSYPGIHSAEFANLPVSKTDLSKAEEVLRYLRETRLNRNSQPQNDNINVVKGRLEVGRPTILFAGCNDYESGIYPYTRESRQQSPVFKSSDEAVQFLSELARKHRWNLIYKPHPIVVYLERVKPCDEGIIRIDDVDINELIDISDVIVTIVSQVSYISLIREKPICMLGYTQLRGKGCTYEAFSLRDVETALEKAVEDGFTSDQQVKFRKHTAQMLKYNLFDDLTDKGRKFGQSMERAVHFLEDALSVHGK